ncbi:hypothetical protein TspCOW1_12660 [Thiohalobacter sp. COW1]|uniref:hypothetical protein n=1 Tax=Thiohalobacter sp. COW1 TaxID=2795687 RepID=UPI00191695E0|nr:hypothetical protein [Thiohalobacter sp. COW1]BCO31163.1 hypothetical protein TspCOW1_12660 [Thiohalobacter sp. COW1]
MYPLFVYKINERFELMPLILKIVCGAAFVLSIFQIAALFFPILSPQIEGVAINAPFFIVLMGAFYIAIGWGVYAKQKWSIPLIVLSPLFQYGILFLDRGLPSEQAIKVNLLFVAVWAVLFVVYFSRKRVKSYFCGVSNA